MKRSEMNPERLEKARATNREWYRKNKKASNNYKARWYQENKERLLAKAHAYRAVNKKKITDQKRQRRNTDPLHNMEQRIRGRLKYALKKIKAGKVAPTKQLVGCDSATLKRWIESKFLPGMTWENRHLWHLDHRVPVAMFDLLDPLQQKNCFHFSNLQPLWGRDNLIKSDSFSGLHAIVCELSLQDIHDQWLLQNQPQ